MTSRYTYICFAVSSTLSFHTEVLREGRTPMCHSCLCTVLIWRANVVCASAMANVHCGVFFFSVSSHWVLGEVFTGLFVIAHIADEVLDLFNASRLPSWHELKVGMSWHGRKLCFFLAKFRILWCYLHHWNIYIMVVEQYLPKNFYVILFKNKTIMYA